MAAAARGPVAYAELARREEEEGEIRCLHGAREAGHRNGRNREGRQRHRGPAVRALSWVKGLVGVSGGARDRVGFGDALTTATEKVEGAKVEFVEKPVAVRSSTVADGATPTP